ncbi:MAG: ATP-binding protein [Candidatus Kapaibacterium sp.]
MKIDAGTVAIIVVITHLIQVAVFFHQYRINKTYSGLGWWLAWSCFLTAGISILVVRSVIPLPSFFIFLQNVLIISGTLLIYVGFMRFLGKRESKLALLLIFVFFITPFSYFLFIEESIKFRSVLINFTLAFIAFFTVINFYRYKTHNISPTANFISVVFVIHGIVFTYIAIETLFVQSTYEVFLPSNLGVLQLFDALIVGLLWTISLVIMVNQRLNSELNESKEHFEHIFNTSPDAAIITSLNEGIVTDLNEGYTKITGFSKEEAIGKSTLDMHIWKDNKDRDAVIKMLKEKGYCDNYEAAFIKKDGKEITGLMSAKIIDFQGEPRVISISRDITERKMIEQKINEQNEELKRINIEKDKFFSIIAHDLRSPFHGLMGLTELMAKELNTFSTDEIQRIASKLNQSANNLYRLLNNLLEWSRMQRGVIKFSPVEINLKTVIEDTLDLYGELSANKGVEIVDKVPDDILFKADLSMIESVVRNLVSNSIKFTNDGDKIIISAEKKDGKVIISVKDTGIGMKKELSDNIFKIDKVTVRYGTNDEPGTGLGLLLCKEFVERNNGEIQVRSEEGIGSEFKIILKASVVKETEEKEIIRIN